MTKLTFIFNEPKLRDNSLTADDMLFDMRTYAKHEDIQETEYGVFSKDGEDAMALLLKYVVDKEKRDPAFITYLDKWEANIDGEIENCLV